MLLAEGISKTFTDKSGTLSVLDGITLSVPRAGVVSLVGPTGCGKTTLLRILAGLDLPTGGRIVYDREYGEDRRHQVGVMFQQPALLSWRTLLENVRLPLELAGTDPEQREEAVKQVIASVGLSGFEGYRPIRMSGGMQARAALARALVRRPPLLLLDEPFASIDEITRSAMYELLIRLLARYRAATVLVTHSLAEAVMLSDKVVVLSARPARAVGVVSVSMPKEERLNEPDNEKLLSARRELQRLLESGMRRADTIPGVG